MKRETTVGIMFDFHAPSLANGNAQAAQTVAFSAIEFPYPSFSSIHLFP